MNEYLAVAHLFLLVSASLFCGYNLGLWACGRKLFDSKRPKAGKP